MSRTSASPYRSRFVIANFTATAVEKANFPIEQQLEAVGEIGSQQPVPVFAELPVSGSPIFPILSNPGNSLGTAINLGYLGGTETLNSAVGGSNPFDVYRFKLSADSHFNLVLDNLNGDADVRLIRDSDRNFTIDPDEAIALSDFGTTAPDSINLSGLSAGTYYLQVYPFAGNSDYRLRLSDSDTSNLLFSEIEVGSLGQSQIFQDIVGNGDTSDLYHFSLGAASSVLVTLDGLSAEANLRLIADSNGNGLVDEGEVIARSEVEGTSPERLDLQNLAAGDYYLQVYQVAGETTYTLEMSAAPKGGEIRGSQWNDLNGNGVRDAGEPGLANWTIYLDQNQNGVLDGGEVTTTTDGSGSYAFTNLAPGTYTVATVEELGWAQTAPNLPTSTYAVTLATGEVVEGIDFGRRGTSAIAESNDTIPLAIASGLDAANSGTFTDTGAIGDNPNVSPGLDVDFIKFQLNAGDRVTVDLDTVASSTSLDSALLLFDSQGTLITESDNDAAPGEAPSLDAYLDFTATASDTYYLGISGAGNVLYDPLVEGSGTAGSIGDYALNIDLLSGTPSHPTVGMFSTTGEVEVDALLNELNLYWDTSTSNSTITYSFLSSEAADSYYGSETVSELSEAIKGNLRGILDSFESFLNVQFVEVTDTANSYGAVRFMFSDAPNYAYAYYPGEGLGGDVHLNPNFEGDPGNEFSGAPGSFGYETLIHETLHAIGLKHPGDYNGSGGGAGPFLSPEEDNNTNSVMTYNFAGEGAATAMPYDMRSLQYLYGASDYNSDDTTYTFDTVYGYTDGNQYFGSQTTPLKQTLWDSGGIDTLDFSNLAALDSGYYFDLNGGGILTTQEAYDSTNYTDQTTGLSFTTSTYGTALAYGKPIEEIINSTSRDRIIANDGANVFRGYSLGISTGDDILENTSSLDLLDLSSYSLADLTVANNGTDLDIDLSTDGSLSILDYFGINGSMIFLIESNYYTYGSSGDWQLAAAPAMTEFPDAIAGVSEATNSIGVTASASTITEHVSPVPTLCNCPICCGTRTVLPTIGLTNLVNAIAAA